MKKILSFLLAVLMLMEQLNVVVMAVTIETDDKKVEFQESENVKGSAIFDAEKVFPDGKEGDLINDAVTVDGITLNPWEEKTKIKKDVGFNSRIGVNMQGTISEGAYFSFSLSEKDEITVAWRSSGSTYNGRRLGVRDKDGNKVAGCEDVYENDDDYREIIYTTYSLPVGSYKLGATYGGAIIYSIEIGEKVNEKVNDAGYYGKRKNLLDASSDQTLAKVGDVYVTAVHTCLKDVYDSDKIVEYSDGTQESYSWAYKSSSISTSRLYSSSGRSKEIREHCFVTAERDSEVGISMYMWGDKSGYVFELNTMDINNRVFYESEALFALDPAISKEYRFKAKAGKYYLFGGVGTNLELLDVIVYSTDDNHNPSVIPSATNAPTGIQTPTSNPTVTEEPTPTAINDASEKWLTTPTGDFLYSIQSGQIVIKDYRELADDIIIPDEIEGLPVTSLERIPTSEFKSILIPSSITSIKYLYKVSGNVVSKSTILVYKDSYAETVCNGHGYAYHVVDSDQVLTGYCGDDAYWELDYKTRTLKITGTGDLYNYSFYYHSPWYKYMGTIEKIEIDEGITGIGKYNFENCINLTDIRLPKGVTKIDDDAFFYCQNLTEMVIPEGVTSIGSNAFVGCSSLKNVKIPKGVISIGSYAFARCSSLENVEIPEDVKSIGQRAFLSCISLTEITIPKSVENIDELAFEGCEKLTLNVYAGSQGYSYARRTGMKYNILDTPTATATKIPTATATKVPTATPTKVSTATQIPTATPTQKPPVIITINPYPDYPDYPDEDDYDYLVSGDFRYYIRNGKAVISDYLGSAAMVSIPSKLGGYDVACIGESAFEDSDNLQKLIIPNSVTQIASSAFSSCYNLVVFVFENSPAHKLFENHYYSEYAVIQDFDSTGLVFVDKKFKGGKKATFVKGDVIDIDISGVPWWKIECKGKAGSFTYDSVGGVLTLMNKGTVKLFYTEGKKKRLVASIKCIEPKLKKMKLKTGKSKKIKMKGFNNVTWLSDNPEIAEVNNGVVTAKSPGTAVIIAYTDNRAFSTTATVK